jgi:hypothetical protein
VFKTGDFHLHSRTQSPNRFSLEPLKVSFRFNHTFTSDAEWQPYSDHFSKAEKAAKNYFQYPDPTHLHFNHNGEQLNGRMIKSTILMDDLIDPVCFTFNHTFDRVMAATSSTIH